jgi:hypothetical protein
MTGRPAAFSWRLVSCLTDFAAERGWPVDRVQLSTELVVVVRKSGAAMKGGSGGPTA